MFSGAEYRGYLGSTFFTGTKMLEQEYVAEQTIEAIRYEKREIILPPNMHFFAYLSPLLWDWLQDRMAVYTNSMSSFVGGKNRLSKL